MSFWTLSDGKEAERSSEFEQAGGDIEPIPDNTDCVVFADEAKLVTAYQSDEKLISIRWRVMKPEAYKNRVLFQKLWVFGNNPQKKTDEERKKQGDNAKRMLAAIDTNTGSGMAGISGPPTDEDLQRNLLNKPMIIKVKKYEMKKEDGTTMSGNWVCAVSPKGSVDIVEPATSSPSTLPVSATMDDLDDEIPF